MTPVDGGSAELLYRDCDFGAGAREVTVRVSGRGEVELLTGGDSAPLTLTLGAPGTGPYAYTSLRARIAVAGVRDVRLRLRGPLRLAHVGFLG
ncbi:hypothetical protein [Streptomyces sp. NPDC004629]|uniref:hypothetical protein n=1 Tax=Streptomyces sp. NPDC004629 TaxID=3364705 RepID=UPI003674A7EF